MDKKTASLLQGYLEKAGGKLAVREAREFLAAAEQYLRQFLPAV